MATTNSELVVRECAFEIIRISQEHKDDNAKLIKALEAPLKRIIAQPDLLSLGVKRQGNHIAIPSTSTTMASSSFLWTSFQRVSASRRMIMVSGKR